nr:VOC family protein [Paracoccus sp. PAMC 22219]
MDKISTFLWLDGRASEAAEFYTGLFPDSRIMERTVSPIDYPGGRAGESLRCRSCLAAAASSP